MAKAKAVNYTPDQVAELVGAYTSATDETERADIVKEYAGKFGKNTRSIIAKLSREGVYQKAEKSSKVTGGKPETKEALAEKLGDAARYCGVRLVSPDKLAKVDMVTLFNYFDELRQTYEVGADMADAERNG